MSPASLLTLDRRHRTSIHSGSAAERVAAWKAFLRVSGHAEIDPAIADGFTADVRTYTLGDALTFKIVSDTFRLLRSKEEAGRVVRDQLFVNFVERGRIIGRLANRRIVAEAGSVLVSRLGMVMDLRFEETSWYGFIVPVSEISRPMGRTASLGPRVFEPGSASAVLLSFHIRSLLELPDVLSAAQAKRIASESVRFLRPHLGCAPVDDARSPPEDEEEPTIAIKRFITERLSDPELRGDMICREFAISRSTLYRLLRGTVGLPLRLDNAVQSPNGVSTLIRRLRLLCAHRDIERSAAQDPETFAAIGKRWGMPEERTFRRAFAAEFGYPPSQARRRKGSDASQAAPVRADAAREIERWFEAWH